MMFGRKKKTDSAARGTEQDVATSDAEATEGTDSADTAAATGPRDISLATSTTDHLDMGALRLVPGPSTDLRLEVDQKTNEVNAVQIADDHGAVQLQVFAAPRSAGIWEDIRGEIAEMITANGGTVETASGPFGDELRSRLAQPGPQGRTVFAPAVFAGVEGPRWFLRAVYSGSAAVDEAAREVFDDVLRTVLVVRGDEPRAPREMLPLHMPTAAKGATPAGDESEAALAEPDGDDLKPFERGPEITEVR